MTYLQPHSRPHQRRSKFLTGCIVGLIVITGTIQLFKPHFFPSLVTTFARPFWRAEFSIKSGLLSSPQALLNENEKLKRELADAEIRIANIHAIELENSELKKMMNRDSVVPVGTSTEIIYDNFNSRILAAVLKHPPYTPYDQLIIDIGKDYEIATSSFVYAPGNVLIGRVS
ncbi:MAG: hypothetical protein M3Q80_03005, partial [bacterium]|nr:hypothetical protein [bacterium]